MSTVGKYLRRRTGGMEDPTMTYMDDPHVVRVGHYLLDDFAVSRVIRIEERSPDIRFAYIEEDVPKASVPGDAVVWDFRNEQGARSAAAYRERRNR